MKGSAVRVRASAPQKACKSRAFVVSHNRLGGRVQTNCKHAAFLGDVAAEDPHVRLGAIPVLPGSSDVLSNPWHVGFHELRHTHATLALAAGIHPKVVSERLGHASITITLDTYSHAIPAMQETAAELVASLVFDA
jgi:hypothetical protein